MRLPDGEVQHRLLGEFQTDEVFGAAVVFVGLDAAEEANALGDVHQSVAVGEFAEVERPPDGGPDRGAAAGQGGQRPLAPTEELSFRQQDQSVLEQARQFPRGQQEATAEASCADARLEATDGGGFDFGVQAVDRPIRISGEQARSAVLGQGRGGAEQGGAVFGALGRRADQQRFRGLAFKRLRRVARGGFIRFFQDELRQLGRVQFGAEDIFVRAVDRNDQDVGREVPEEGGLGDATGIIAWGADHEPVDFPFAPLRRGVKGSEGLDLVAEQVDAHGHLRVQRVDVEDAAAQGVFPGLFTKGFVVVAELAGEALRKGPELERVAFADDHLRPGRRFRGGGSAGQGSWGAGDEQGPLGVVLPVPQQGEHAEQVAIGFKGRHRGIGFGQGSGDGLRAVQQRQELRRLFRQRFGRAEVGGQQDDDAVGGAFRTGHGRPSVRGHAGQGTAWLNGHPAIQWGRSDWSNAQRRKQPLSANQQ